MTSSTIECRSCGATLELGDAQRTAVCLFCASPSVLERPPTRDRPQPRFAMGFVIAKRAAQEIVSRWARRGNLFRDSGLAKADIAEMHGAYVPAWLYSASADADWQARIGESYTETKTEHVMVNGKPQTRTRVVTKTEWHDLAGRWTGYVHDVLVTASRGIGNHELEQLEPFDLGALRRYTPALISGWPAEDPTLDRAESLRLARGEAAATLERHVEAFMPGDHHQVQSVSSRASLESLDLVLVPVWIVAVRHRPDAPPLRVLVNGLSGKLVGRKPLVWWKVALALLAVVLPIVVAIYLYTQGAL
jgi:hypothetical protein